MGLIEVSCLLIASKFEEMKSPTLRDAILLAQLRSSVDEAVQMEKQILNVLGWDLNISVTVDFVNFF